VDLIAKDEIRSVDGSSPARVIEPYHNSTSAERNLAPIMIPGSPNTAYADPLRPLSSHSAADNPRPLSPTYTYTDSSFYGGGGAKSPVSEKLPLADSLSAGPSKVPPSPAVFMEPETGTPMRERDGGVSLLSAEGVYSPMPPPYVTAVSGGDAIHDHLSS
jgi:hypothetical protein